MWPCTILAGKQMFSDITDPTPFAYSSGLDESESWTLKPHSTSRVFQNGKFSYMFITRGTPSVRLARPAGSVARSKSSSSFRSVRLVPLTKRSPWLE